MFYKYEIRNINGEDVLYLYLTMSYEFSKELKNTSSDTDLTRRTKNFIKNNNIDYKGKKVFLVIDGIVVKSLDISHKEEIEVLKESLYYSNEYYLVTVQYDNNINIEISLREYLLGALAGIYSEKLELETLKAIAILFRTYVFKMMSERRYINAYDDLLEYSPISDYKALFLVNYNEVYNLLSRAISETDCLFITYNNNYILPFIHYSNDGFTREDDCYPYLRRVNSVWDMASPYYVDIVDFTYQEISNLLRTKITVDSTIKITKLEDDKFVKELEIDGSNFIVDDLLKILKLKSNNMHIIMNRDFIRFITTGYGNYLGLSIFGANELAKNECKYSDILKYYFPDIKINKYIKELS